METYFILNMLFYFILFYFERKLLRILSESYCISSTEVHAGTTNAIGSKLQVAFTLLSFN